MEDRGKPKEELVKELQRLRERQQVGELLRDSEARYRLLVENITDVIWTMDMNLRLTYVSPSIAHQSGRTVEEAMAMTLEDMFPPDSLAIVTQVVTEEFAIENNGEGNPYISRTIEVEMWHKDGSTRWTEITASFLRNPEGQPVGIVGLTRDITERRNNVERRLQESEDRYRVMADNIVDVLFTIDMDLRVTYISPSVKDMLGYTPEEVMGLDILSILTPTFLAPDSLRLGFAVCEEALALKNPGAHDPSRTRDLELQLMHRDGSAVWVEVKTSFLHGTGDSPIGIQGMARDITQRRKAEEAVRELERKQEMAVLEERNRMAREIHDTLAQGLTGIIWQLTAAERVLDRSDGEARKHMTSAKNLARESLNEARRSVQDLRPQALERLSLQDSLDEEIRKFSEASGAAANLGISGEVQTMPPKVESALLRICQECLNNVRKHACASQVQVRLSFEEGAVNMSVQDNGVGFDHEIPPQGCFGLISMSERARLLGGALEIRSEKGVGTYVEVSVPTSR